MTRPIFGHDDRTMNNVVLSIITIIVIITDVDVDLDPESRPGLGLGSVSRVDAVIACVGFDRPIMPNTTLSTKPNVHRNATRASLSHGN